MMRIKSISKSFGGLQALSECNLEIRNKKITAIIGPNGSGKTTLFNIISQILKQDSGEIMLNEKNLTELLDFQVAKLGVSRTFQEVRLFRNLTVGQHLEIALSESDEKLLKSVFKKSSNKNKKISDILSLVNLQEYSKFYATDLSYGQRKLLDLAIAVAKPHKVLMLDEPVAGINPKIRVEIKKILKSLMKKGETILLIEHDMNFVMGLADYIYVLDYGKVIAQGSPREIKKNQKVLEAYLGK